MALRRKKITEKDNCDLGKLWQFVFYVCKKAWWILKHQSQVIHAPKK